LLFGCAWTINAAGSIKQRKADEGAEPAMLINALFPHRLARMAEESHTQILQIATDCVFSGREGGRVESSPHDALDVYGKTKSLGEVRAPHVHHLRCSIIGPDRRKKISLLEWFLHEPRAASVPGFTNHRWNGITTYHFARICAGILRSRATLSGLQHIVPEGWMTKHELLKLLSQVYERKDIQVVRTEAKQAVDRTLETVNPIENCRLWSLGGYRHPPSIPEMVRELAQIEPELGFQR
jgi:dTDP-4-dehydrorhamnose reductase